MGVDVPVSEEGIFVSGKTLVRPAVMVLPVDEPVQITLTSRDVIHSFFIPALLFKRDAIPGRTSTFTRACRYLVAR